MISSSYFPPSSGSTPQRTSETKDSAVASPRSPNFYEMPTTEILSSATTRSAFLQSLQRSREREERREREKSYGYSSVDAAYNNKFESGQSLDKSDYYNSSNYSSNPNNIGSNHNGNYSDNYGSNQNGNYSGSYSGKTTDYYPTETAQTSNTFSNDQQPQTNLSTPIMSRRRLTSSPTSSSKSSKSIASTPIKPLNSATPASQSKLASHAFTMSRSSNEDETERKDEAVYAVGSPENDFKRRYEEEFNRNQLATNVPTIAITPLKPQSNTITSSNQDDLRTLIDSVVESHTLSLKNDLQNLHIELIKQSVAQQSAFRSLLETYLPLTGKLMESLKEEREENGRLKMRIEELSRSSRTPRF